MLPPVRVDLGDMRDIERLQLLAGTQNGRVNWIAGLALQAQRMADPIGIREPNTEPTPWLRAKSAPTWLLEPDREFQGLAKDLVAPGAITLIASPRALGKTQTSHALAVALATCGVFRSERVKAARVLLLDRDNPEQLGKRRLWAWGAIDATNLKVLTHQDAPALSDRAAWEQFPVEDYEVLIVDSIGSSTEGITEKEGKQTTEVLATLRDLAHKLDFIHLHGWVVLPTKAR